VQGPSANQGGGICNGLQDQNKDPTYMCAEADVDAIATAHCALAANGEPAADLSAFQKGNYATVKMGPCGSTCPAECGCDTSTMNCVAPWLAVNGGSSSGALSDAGSGTSGGSASGGGATSSSTGSSGSGRGSTTSGSSGGATGSGTTSGGTTSGGATSSSGVVDGGA